MLSGLIGTIKGRRMDGSSKLQDFNASSHRYELPASVKASFGSLRNVVCHNKKRTPRWGTQNRSREKSGEKGEKVARVEDAKEEMVWDSLKCQPKPAAPAAVASAGEGSFAGGEELARREEDTRSRRLWALWRMEAPAYEHTSSKHIQSRYG